MMVKKAALKPFYLNVEFERVYASKRKGLGQHRGLFLILSTWMLTLFLFGRASAQEKGTVVRLAKLQIDAAQLASYQAALKQEIETSVRVEPGVLSLYAVFEKNNPTHITIFEIYANEDSYKAHLETPHFKKYKTITKAMVKSLELVETVPLVLGAKAK